MNLGTQEPPEATTRRAPPAGNHCKGLGTMGGWRLFNRVLTGLQEVPIRPSFRPAPRSILPIA